MSDLIDRKEAIDALERSKKIYFDRQVIIGAMKDIVRNLPSAQPEIIRCRDCKYWEREKPFATSGRCFIWECANRKGSDYCSEARRTADD